MHEVKYSRKKGCKLVVVGIVVVGFLIMLCGLFSMRSQLAEVVAIQNTLEETIATLANQVH